MYEASQGGRGDLNHEWRHHRTGGITRVDVSGAGKGCRTVWTNGERVPSTVSKVSLVTGLLYTYTKDPEPNGVDAWYLTAIDLRTGKTIYQGLAGTGPGYNNNFAPVSIGPDGAAYVGALGGLIELRDRSA